MFKNCVHVYDLSLTINVLSISHIHNNILDNMIINLYNVFIIIFNKKNMRKTKGLQERVEELIELSAARGSRYINDVSTYWAPKHGNSDIYGLLSSNNGFWVNFSAKWDIFVWRTLDRCIGLQLQPRKK